MLNFIKKIFFKENQRQNNFIKYGANLKCGTCGVWSHDTESVLKIEYKNYGAPL